MGKKVNPTVVGAFVLGAISLVVLGIIVIGGGNLFRRSHRFVLYFSSDVNGLRVGAPVKFRGVEIGSVVAVMLSVPGMEGGFRQSNSQIRIPVVIQLDSAKLISHGAEINLDDPEEMQQAIAVGLRGQLATESILTGLQYVDLDMHPKEPAKFFLGKNSPYPEIPTLPTTFEQAQIAATRVLAALEQIDFNKLVGELTRTAEAVTNLVTSPKLNATIDALNRTANSMSASAQSIQRLSDSLDRKVKPISQSLVATTEQARATLKQTQETLAAVQESLGPGSPVNYELTQTLQDTSQAARSLKQLTDYLQRNPSSVLRGRAQPADSKGDLK
ncbi:MAG TPA: MlaD family protein [Candidatus Binataceae bacterium]|nr:MlaD family protein [Candidatus Binataceae bacterium]